MKEFTQKTKIVGFLRTPQGSYDLLNINPVKTFSAIPDSQTFYAVVGGCATRVLVKGNFLVEIIPDPVESYVKFIIDDEKEEPTNLPADVYQTG